ncbi:MAG: S8 family serine peptidase [Pseudomonadota bacterium]
MMPYGRWKDSGKINGPSEFPEAHWRQTIGEGVGLQLVSLRASAGLISSLLNLFGAQYGESYKLAVPPIEDQGVSDALRTLVEGGLRLWVDDLLASLEEASNEEDAFELVIMLDTSQPGVLEALTKLQPPSGSPPTMNSCVIVDVSSPIPMGADSQETRRLAETRAELSDQLRFDDDAVIVVVIDDGIGIANQRFQIASGDTRIEYFNDLRWRDAGGGGGRIEQHIFDRKCINTHLAEQCDEESVYRAMQMIVNEPDRREPLKFATSHGTHMLDAAAGFNPGDPIARKRPIIAVQLPSEVIADRSDSLMAGTLRVALRWVERAARTLRTKDGRHLPLVVNFSFGVFAGPHDGTSPIENTIRSFIGRYRGLPGNPACEFVLPAGNGFQERATAQLTFETLGQKRELIWRVQPDDKTSAYLQIWLPPVKHSSKEVTRQRVRITLTPPSGKPRPKGSKLGRMRDWIVEEEVYARMYHQQICDAKGTQSRERITIAIRPTETERLCDVTSPPGAWTVGVENLALESCEVVDLRIQRDDSLNFQRRTGRQSYFDDKDYVRYEQDTRLRNDAQRDAGAVTRRRTLNAYATGYGRDAPLVVAGYRRSDGEPALYSGAGPTDAGRPGPDMSSVTEESPAHFGVLASGTYSGSIKALNGTSVAAPALTRALANVMSYLVNQGGDPSTAADTLLMSIDKAEKAGITGPHGPYSKLESKTEKQRYGKGRFVKPPPPPWRHRIEG